MIQVHIIGQGALGADFTIEAARRCEAAELDMGFNLIDFDEVEFPRNCVSQAFLPIDAGKKKAQVIADRLAGFKVKTKAQVEKLTKENWQELLEDQGDYNFIVDCVDNAATRQLLWEIGMLSNTPVLHLGISPRGEGHVTWNYQGHDSFPLSPATTSPSHLSRAIEAAKDVKIPPCELSALRPMITLAAQAGVTALFIACGADLSKEFGEDAAHTRGVLSIWNVDRWSAQHEAERATQETL